MEQVIYIDILIVTNIIINFFLILLTSKIMYLKINYTRLILGEILGAIYSLYILLPDLNFFISIIIKFLMSMSIIFVTFDIKNIKLFVKSLICFYVISFGFSGLVFFIWSVFRPKNLLINNSIIYLNISPVILIFSVLISYLIFEISNYIFDKNKNKFLIHDIYINLNNKSIKFNGKLDTCNNLIEPFSQLPVIIVRKSSIQKILPDNFLDINNSKNLRLVPFRTISNEGLLPAFKPDSIILENSKKQAYVAVCEDNFLSQDTPVLINSLLLN
ncbi:MAG: sigma-E processing peptidase SpoIIGA [Clostridia bacterium]|nr:sigma-E processing peptidase SpoIIGA [Clostridia bacterium]